MADYVRLGELLVGAGLVAQEQLDQALELQAQEDSHQRLGTLLISLGLITEDHLCRALSIQLGLELADLSIEAIDPNAIDAVPEQWAIRHNVVPLRINGDEIVVASADPTNRWAAEDIAQVTGKRVRLVVAPESDVRIHVRRQYEMLRKRRKEGVQRAQALKSPNAPYSSGSSGTVASGGMQGGRVSHAIDEQGGPTVAGVKGGVIPDEAGAVRTVNDIIKGAISYGASDVSLLSQPDGLQVRFRVDGVFHIVATIGVELRASVVSRIKILCELDVAEHRKPQDGRARFTVDGSECDLRIVVFPTMYGESVVIRILDRMDGLPLLESLGMRPRQLEVLMEQARRPQGMILITGPTGSGKTTTVYATLGEIASPELNILTLEDPVEYEMPGIGQVQVGEKSGVTFAQGMKSFLRAAPNVIFIGECRDLEVASLAFQAGLTGHLVISTLHTNDAISTIMRLQSMGVEPFLIASTLSLVVAQRLIRRICPDCKRQLQPSPGILRLIRVTEEQAAQHVFYGGTGCPKCEMTGYKGRIGIYEILEMTDSLRAVIIAGGTEQELRVAARAAGVQTLRQEALLRAFNGQTTLEEVVRVTDMREHHEDRCPRCGLPLPGIGRPCPKCAALAVSASG